MVFYERCHGNCVKGPWRCVLLFSLIVKVHCETMVNPCLERDRCSLFFAWLPQLSLGFQISEAISLTPAGKCKDYSLEGQPINDACCFPRVLLSCPKRALKMQLPWHLSTSNSSRSKAPESKQLPLGQTSKSRGDGASNGDCRSLCMGVIVLSASESN